MYANYLLHIKTLYLPVKNNPAIAKCSGVCVRYDGQLVNEVNRVDLIAYFGYLGLSIQTPIFVASELEVEL